MKVPTREEQRRLVRQWETTGPELERIRRDVLRGMAYAWVAVDALLELGDHYDAMPRSTSGLVEMQRWFIKAALRLKPPEPDPGMNPDIIDCAGRDPEHG